MAAKTLITEVDAVSLDFQIDKLGYVRCAKCLNEERGGETFHLCEMGDSSLNHHFRSFDVEACDFCSTPLWEHRQRVVATSIVEYHGVKIF